MKLLFQFKVFESKPLFSPRPTSARDVSNTTSWGATLGQSHLRKSAFFQIATLLWVSLMWLNSTGEAKLWRGAKFFCGRKRAVILFWFVQHSDLNHREKSDRKNSSQFRRNKWTATLHKLSFLTCTFSISSKCCCVSHLHSRSKKYRPSIEHESMLTLGYVLASLVSFCNEMYERPQGCGCMWSSPKFKKPEHVTAWQ